MTDDVSRGHLEFNTKRRGSDDKEKTPLGGVHKKEVDKIMSKIQRSIEPFMRRKSIDTEAGEVRKYTQCCKTLPVVRLRLMIPSLLTSCLLCHKMI